MTPATALTTLLPTLARHGLQLRGAWPVQPGETLPPLPDGSRPAQVCLVGVVGSDFWPHFQASAFYRDGRPDPLDRWSQAIGDDLAARLGGQALYPFTGPPYHPFQQWADRGEPTQASALMLRIHPVHGLWHAYRFALALPGPLLAAAQQPPAPAATDLCAQCSGQPCLQACPVAAYTGERFVLEACARHLHSGAGADCMQSGCQARRACPVAPDLRYTPEHAAFHMQAFARNHG